MTLKWNKCQGEVWCQLKTVNLDHSHFNLMNGVYVIWHGGPAPHTVYVGLGFVRDRLIEDRLDSNINAYSPQGLFVTWASVSPVQQLGVYAFLHQHLSPRLRREFPPAVPIIVNLPWT